MKTIKAILATLFTWLYCLTPSIGEATTNVNKVPQVGSSRSKSSSNTLTIKESDKTPTKPLRQTSKETVADYLNRLLKDKQFEAIAKFYRENRESINSPGKHNYTMALFFFKTEQLQLFYKQALLYLLSNNSLSKYKYRIIKNQLKSGDYKRIIQTLKNRKSHQQLDISSHNLLIYCLLKDKNFKEAHKTIRDRVLSKTNSTIREMNLLMNLALKLKDGSEAAFWGEKILTTKAEAKKNPILLNNLAISYLYQYNEDKKTAKTLQKALNYHLESLKLKRKSYIYHTGSLIHEALGNFKKALKMINFCRALNPGDKSIINRYRQLHKKIKKGSK